MSWKRIGESVGFLSVFFGFLFFPALSSLRAEEGGWTYLTDGKSVPTGTAWEGERTLVTLIGEGLRISAPLIKGSSGCSYGVAWGASTNYASMVEAKLKIISGSADSGNSLGLANGTYKLVFTFFPDRIELDQPKKVVPFNTADGFHVYRVELKNKDFRFLADDKLLLDGQGLVTGTEKVYDNRDMLSFGSGPSGAAGEGIWQFIRYKHSGTNMQPSKTGILQTPQEENIQQARIGIIQTPHLAITVGRTVSIVPPAEKPESSFSFFQYKDGRIVVKNYWSKDGGETWEKGGGGPGVGAVELPDGTVLNTGWMALYSGKQGEYKTTISRTTPDGKTVTEDAKAFIPDGAESGVNDEGVSHDSAGAFDHGTILLVDGSLLAVMYGRFRDDKVQIPTFDFKCYKTRCWAMRSTDQGKTWNYLSTIAYDPSIGLESFCEPALLKLPNGDILCFMRTGGSGWPCRYTPLYLSRSTDQGKTWSKPEPIADRGVWPNACRSESGILAVTYGRPFQWLAFSADDGKTWEGHHCFYSPNKFIQWYNYVATVGKDKFLAIYQRDGEKDPKTGEILTEIVGTFFTVKRR
ncbi:MAG: sialidase family protein [Kiritimatiellaeota bacterium]|nr:sialidase family protein [Kiritimatiellota bacterium]